MDTESALYIAPTNPSFQLTYLQKSNQGTRQWHSLKEAMALSINLWIFNSYKSQRRIPSVKIKWLIMSSAYPGLDY